MNSIAKIRDFNASNFKIQYNDFGAGVIDVARFCIYYQLLCRSHIVLGRACAVKSGMGTTLE